LRGREGGEEELIVIPDKGLVRASAHTSCRRSQSALRRGRYFCVAMTTSPAKPARRAEPMKFSYSRVP
jgi:hypothetical protein